MKVLILTWNAQQQKNEYTESDIRACLWLSDRDIALASTRFQVEKIANQHDLPIFWLTNHQPRKLKQNFSKKLKKLQLKFIYSEKAKKFEKNGYLSSYIPKNFAKSLL